MLLEIISDRMSGKPYTEDVKYCLYDYASFFEMYNLVNAMDMECNEEVQQTICSYLETLSPNNLEKYIEFVNTHNWI